MKRLTFLSLFLTVSVLSSNLFAYPYGGGTGEPNEPYLIYDANQMNAIGADPCNWDKHFKLKADIDLSRFTGTDFNIIGYWDERGPNEPFTGVFDGAGHIISNFQYACGYKTDYVALFGYVGGGEIKNLGLKDVAIKLSEGSCVATLVGFNEGTVSNCYATGSVWADYAVGGLVSINYGEVSCCFAKTSVTSGPSAGGLVAYNPGSISNCYATGQVMGSGKVGGLVCQNWGTIVNCYATGWVMPGGHIPPGGLVGLNCCGDVIDSFWDTETSQMSHSDGGTGLPTDEMQIISTFIDAGWDFVETWGIGENQTYPFLRQYPAGDINHDRRVDFLDVAIIADHWLEGAGQ